MNCELTPRDQEVTASLRTIVRRRELVASRRPDRAPSDQVLDTDRLDARFWSESADAAARSERARVLTASEISARAHRDDASLSTILFAFIIGVVVGALLVAAIASAFAVAGVQLLPHREEADTTSPTTPHVIVGESSGGCERVTIEMVDGRGLKPLRLQAPDAQTGTVRRPQGQGKGPRSHNDPFPLISSTLRVDGGGRGRQRAQWISTWTSTGYLRVGSSGRIVPSDASQLSPRLSRLDSQKNKKATCSDGGTGDRATHLNRWPYEPREALGECLINFSSGARFTSRSPRLHYSQTEIKSFLRLEHATAAKADGRFELKASEGTFA